MAAGWRARGKRAARWARVGRKTARALLQMGQKENKMSDFFVTGAIGAKGQHPEEDFQAMLKAKHGPGDWSIPEAFLAILFVAVTCDGEVAAIEHETLLALAHRSRALKTLSAAQLGQLNVQILERMRRGEKVLIDACAVLPKEMGLPVFAHAFDLVLADSELNEDEADFLNSLILGLDLHRDDINPIVEVIALKNRF